ncbi:hypothetical protein ACVWZI_002257 [Thermostichus sp. OS-CIW-28]
MYPEIQFFEKELVCNGQRSFADGWNGCKGQVLSNQLSIDYPSDYLVDILHNRMLLGTADLFYKVSNNPINWFPKFGL